MELERTTAQYFYFSISEECKTNFFLPPLSFSPLFALFSLVSSFLFPTCHAGVAARRAARDIDALTERRREPFYVTIENRDGERGREKWKREREKKPTLAGPSFFFSIPPPPIKKRRRNTLQCGASSSIAAFKAATSAPRTVASSTTAPSFTNLNVGTAAMFWSPQLFETESLSTSIL